MEAQMKRGFLEACVLGGVEVDEYESIPFISQLANLGEIDTSDVADPAAP